MRIEGPSGITPQSGEQKYTTVAGDTLRAIATKFHVGPDDLKDANSLKIQVDDQLQVGLELTIPQLVKEQETAAGIVEQGDIVVQQRDNPFDPGGPIGNWGQDVPTWSEGGDPYDPPEAPTWTERSPAKGDVYINPADKFNINKKIGGGGTEGGGGK